MITVLIAGQVFADWESLEFTGSKSEACWTFSLEISTADWRGADRKRLLPGQMVEIRENNDMVVRAVIDQRRVHLNATTVGVTLAGRTKAKNAVDSGHKHPTHHVKNKNVLDMAREIDHTGTEWSTSSAAQSAMFPRDYHLNAGATIFAEVERFARPLGLTLMGLPDGGVEIAAAGDERHSDLVEGRDFEDIEVNLNHGNRHSEYRVKGQRRLGSGALSHEVEAVARDAGVTDPRTAVVVIEHDLSPKEAKKRAEHRRDQAAGNAIKASIQLPGWRDGNGQLWRPNRRVFVDSPTGDLAQDMLVESVSGSARNNGGMMMTLSLVDPRAHGGKSSGKNSSGPSWSSTHDPASNSAPLVGDFSETPTVFE